MNVFATNHPTIGYQWSGSVDSFLQAQEWCAAHNMTFTHWYVDDGVEPMPDWIFYVVPVRRVCANTLHAHLAQTAGMNRAQRRAAMRGKKGV